MARYIDADKIVDIIKMDIKQCEIDVSESCGDEFYEMAVNSRSNAMYSILREIENAPTADVVPREINKDNNGEGKYFRIVRYTGDALTVIIEAEKIKQESAREILSDLKKAVHDKAVYPSHSGISPYISIKAFDAILQDYLNKLEKR